MKQYLSQQMDRASETDRQLVPPHLQTDLSPQKDQL